VFSSNWKETDPPEKFSYRLAARLMMRDSESSKKGRKHDGGKATWNTFRRALKLKRGNASLSKGTRSVGQELASRPKQVANHPGIESESGSIPETVKTYEESYLVDAKRDANSVALSLWDFGGQNVFYSMHHSF